MIRIEVVQELQVHSWGWLEATLYTVLVVSVTGALLVGFYLTAEEPDLKGSDDYPPPEKEEPSGYLKDTSTIPPSPLTDHDAIKVLPKNS